MQGWPRTLTWNDFQPIPNPGPGQMLARNGQPIVARVALSIMFYENSSFPVEEGNAFKYSFVDVRLVLNRAATQFVPSRLPDRDRAYYLRHEQGHVDLMGLFARELEAKLLALSAPSRVALNALARPLVDQTVESARMYAINSSVDCLYDQETNHGMNRSRQAHWNAVIQRNIARCRRPGFIFQT
ncbi:MAG: hypothetical protein C0504_00140 [Candidatus Solibacter sp.]|nr:hypothetical protein [Candidatus Solibacter sp.]